jgi:hypothetical protein
VVDIFRTTISPPLVVVEAQNLPSKAETGRPSTFPDPDKVGQQNWAEGRVDPIEEYHADSAQCTSLQYRLVVPR